MKYDYDKSEERWCRCDNSFVKYYESIKKIFKIHTKSPLKCFLTSQTK